MYAHIYGVSVARSVAHSSALSPSNQMHVSRIMLVGLAHVAGYTKAHQHTAHKHTPGTMQHTSTSTEQLISPATMQHSDNQHSALCQCDVLYSCVTCVTCVPPFPPRSAGSVSTQWCHP